MEYRKGTKVFNDWVIVKELGEGANGKVFEIHKTDYGITAKSALKVIRVPKSVSDIKAALQEGMDEASVSSYFQGFVEEIVKEILVMSNLQGHPNIVAYQDHRVVPHEGSLGWDILIRMELLTPLVDYQLQRPLTEKEVLRMAKELCGALEYCQRQGMIHRDIKPENIFVSRTGQFKLGDFGVARTVEKTMGGLSRKGTEKYMAPEVYLNRPYGASVDIYSLGLVLYSYLNQGRLPFYPPVPAPITFADRENALGRRMNGEPIPKPQAENERFAEIIQKACTFDSKERYHTAAEMLAALKQADNLTDVRTVVKDKEVEKKTAAEECIEEEKTVGTEIPTLEEEKTVGMGIPIPEEEKTIGMEIPVPQEEEKTIGMEIPMPEEEKTVGMEISVPQEEKTIGMEIPIPQKKREDTEKKEPCRGKDFHLQQVIDAEMARKGGSITVKVGARTIPVQIQKGIEDKHTLKLTGQGGKGINGGSNGDVYVKILIASELEEKEKPELKKQMQAMGWKKYMIIGAIILAFVMGIILVGEINEPNTIDLEDLSEEGQKAYRESYTGEMPLKDSTVTWETSEETAWLERWIPAFEQWNAWDGYMGNANLYTDSQEDIIEQIPERGYEIYCADDVVNEEIFTLHSFVDDRFGQSECVLSDMICERTTEYGRSATFTLGVGIDLSDAEAVRDGKEELIPIMPEALGQFVPGTKITIDKMGPSEDLMSMWDAEGKAAIAVQKSDYDEISKYDVFFEYNLSNNVIWQMSISVDQATGIITEVRVSFFDYANN